MSYIGIDIGTTSICGVIIENKRQIKSITRKNQSGIEAGNKFEKLQSPEMIKKTVVNILEELMGQSPEVKGIGITGQMHGILYVDAEGKAVSRLYTWQDRSGDENYDEKESYCERLSRLTGYSMASGYGLTTLYTHKEKNNIPLNAYKIVTIQEYIVWQLTLKEPCIHPTNAASLGLFNLEKTCWDYMAMHKAGINPKMLLKMAEDENIEGTYRGIPVAQAIGDNQASFLGSMGENKNGILVNIGTGSQVSLQVDKPFKGYMTEARPYIKGKYLLVGAPLCGGRAYAALKIFFEKLQAELSINYEMTYALMDKMAEKAQKDNELTVNTELEGSRSYPKNRGKIEGLGLDNFTPGSFCLGFLKGTVRELKMMYQDMVKMGKVHPEYVVMSGNGLRNSALWRKIVEEEFEKPAQLAYVTEEAACGAALYAQLTLER